ncbi:type IV secretion system protein VirB10 [Paracoccus thiocyanatus]|uniref:Type IV secretion system protein VirB10 n=1 Tax=Paracoccus thiocyanatus TaxID=34006 RepID=A0A1N6ZEX7_9RHOB|nr:TrbI/VirB10 family protein [Paracoccus thiocyanatus]SIR25276.1 type IV secretion system protein VirB10 [Paracoccus thiocyanatus]
MTETAELRKRLDALEGGGAGSGSGTRKRSVLLLVALGIAGAAVLLAVVAFMSGGSEPAPMETAAPAEFQDTGPGFGTLDPVAPPGPAPPAAAPAEENPETEALRAELAAMRAELTALRDAPPPDPPAMDTAALEALNVEIAALRSEAAESEAALRAELEDRARQIQRLQTDLELARLEAPTVTPGPTGPTEEELRLQELERRRQEERAILEARIASPIIAFGSAGSVGDESPSDQRRLDGETEFVRNGAQPATVTQAQTIVNPANTVVQGTLIQAVLETAIDSQLAGPVRALVSEDVHAFDGSRVLIPRGSRLIGRYQSGADIAQQRITIAWDRIILPDNQSVEISAFGGDELGRSGTTGYVDSRFATRFGSAALISLIGGLPTAAAGSTEDETTADALEGTAESLQDTTQGVIGEYLALAPVIYVDQGTRVTVMVDRDLEIF